MKVIALQPGYFGKLMAKDEVFEVPEGEKASWFVPVEQAEFSAAEDEPKPANAAKAPKPTKAAP